MIGQYTSGKPRTMKSVHCTMNAIAAEWVLNQMSSQDTLYLWRLAFYGNVMDSAEHSVDPRNAYHGGLRRVCQHDSGSLRRPYRRLLDGRWRPFPCLPSLSWSS